MKESFLIKISIVLLVICALVGCNKDSIGVQIFEENITLSYADQILLEYQTAVRSKDGAYPRSHYFHPIYNLEGEVITEDFPEDHLHQRGIFWAWHQVYVGAEKVGDLWTCDKIIQKVQNTSTNIISSKEVELLSEVEWIITDSTSVYYEVPIIKEDLELTVTILNSTTYKMEFYSTYAPLVDSVGIGGSEDEKGYGGFSMRFVLPDDVIFNEDEKLITPEVNAMNLGERVSLEGTFGEDQKTRITMRTHDIDHPNWHGWILRSSRSMQNVAIPGNEVIFLNEDESLLLRNEIVIDQLP